MGDKEFENRIKEADRVISNLLDENKVVKLLESEKWRFLDFYKKQAFLSIITADILHNISTTSSSKEFHKLDPNYECFLWVINASYYAMFYSVHSLLAYKGIRILSAQGIHKITAHALIYYFIKNNFIAKKLYEQFVASQQDAVELFNLEDFQKRAMNLASSYFYESDKRTKFTYEIGEEAKQKHALTSLQRAKEFINELEQIIEK